MNCQDVKELIHPYADDELDILTAREVDDHLSACAACRGRLGRVRAVKEAVGGQYFKAPEGLRASVMGRLVEESRSQSSLTPTGPGAAAHYPRFSRRESSSSWWRTVALAAVVVIVGGLVLLVPRGGDNPVVAEVLTAHVRSLQPGHLTDVESSDRHTVKPWFDTHVDFSPPVKQLRDQGFPLVGGRLDYLEDRPVAALVYSRGKHTINLFVWPGESGGGAEQRRGFNLLHWSAGGMTFWAISDVSAEDLEQFARLLRENAGPPATTLH